MQKGIDTEQALLAYFQQPSTMSPYRLSSCHVFDSELLKGMVMRPAQETKAYCSRHPWVP